MNKNSRYKQWNKSTSDVFWGEVAPCDHVVQIYESDAVIISALEGFAIGGFRSGESVVLIATEPHLAEVKKRLVAHGFNLDALAESDSFIAVNAEETLSRFMKNGWPDEALFRTTITGIVTRARGSSRRGIRAYGEMVAILWEQGFHGATVQLEHLWNVFCETENFTLFCAYPKSGFTQSMRSAVDHICSAHARVLAGDSVSSQMVYYNAT